MKFFRFGEQGKEKPGIILDNRKYNISSFGEDYNEHFFETDGINRLKYWLSNNKNLEEIPDSVRLGPCIARPSKIICIGLNYADHARETNAKIPDEPIIFFKSTTALSGPEDNLIIPQNSIKTDWEVELAVIIGKKTSYISEDEALNHVAGYCLHNDYSEREFQLEKGGQWVKGKSCDTFAPIGPYWVTHDEIFDIDNLSMWLKVNGKTMQDSSTSNLIFKIPFLIHYLSRFMTLLPGDLISTGTPAGVGLGFKPPIYLKSGDTIELSIEGLGTQKQVAINY